MNETNFLTLSSGRRLCYAEYGDPQGRPLMYFHGWPSSRLQAAALHELCVEKGVRLIAPDRPGVGKSELQPGRTLRDWPPLVIELADSLGWDKFSVMGVSGGGPYAVVAAAGLPGRVEQTAVVCGAPPLAKFPDRSAMMWPYRALLRIRPHAPFLIPGILRASHWISQFPPEKAPMSWVMRWTAQADREALQGAESFETVTRSFREGISAGTAGVQIDGDVYTDDWGLDFSQITVPIEFWHGEEDRNIPFAMVKEYASWIPGARTRYFPGEGHYSIIARSNEGVLESLFGEKEKVAAVES
ncbi:alpha/beta fold hydrolase [Roseibacillus ishigakijimensis]|uniref:Alpha/beta hydrolase n=1 Tax=Roseibacillus ishigakijimensis TaxID=454146 RepID=A0A934RP56_9BACT|nr:alpha/beta hydrolase [Roseibacillus ishigakijimensis]MBK1832918.1 alpha/beta hydrolase [Roseibacillus ishigakijimensis]